MKYRILLLLLVVAALLMEGYAFYTILTKQTTHAMKEDVAKTDFTFDR